MSPDLMTQFPSNQPATKTVTVISKSGSFSNIVKVITPGIISLGKQHYNCPSFDGIPLENNGGDGSANSHWEKLYVGNELMTSQITGNPVLSLFTLTLMQDSGWYNMDLSKAENLDWGKGQGCSFFNYQCDTAYPEFCPAPNSSDSGTTFSCSKNYKAKLVCTKGTFTDSCYTEEFQTGQICNNNLTLSTTYLSEVAGKNSRCFSVVNGNSVLPACFESNCVGGAVQIKVGSVTQTCPSTNAKLTFGSITLFCPDATDFCSKFSQQCPNDCSGQGRCLIGGCFCNFFNTGSDCSGSAGCAKSKSICELLGVSIPTNDPTPSSNNTSNNTNNLGVSSLVYSWIFAIGFLVLSFK